MPDLTPTEHFVESVYAAEAWRGLQLLIEYLDDALIDRRVEDANSAIATLDVGRLTGSQIVSVLGITLRMPRTDQRASFYRRARREMTKRKGWWYSWTLLRKYR